MRTPPIADRDPVRPAPRRHGGPAFLGLPVGILAAVLARPSGATIVIDSKDQAVIDKVNAALQKIKNSDPAKKAKIEALESSSNMHKISQGSDDENTPDDSKKAGSGPPGSGSRTTWKGDGTEQLDSDVNRDPTAALFHELVHACDADKGMRNPKPVQGPDGPIKGNEVNAVTVENMYRMVVGLPLRTKYGGRRLPASGTTTTSSTTTTSTSTTTTSLPSGCSNANLFVSPGNCGQVVSNPSGINCPPTCNAMFSTSSPVHLFGQAPTSTFSGDCDAAGNVQLQNAQPGTGCSLTCACNAP